MSPVLLDASVIVALFDRSERRHRDCVTAVEALESVLVTCEAVISESCYVLRGLSGAGEAILENVERGVFQIPFQLPGSAGAMGSIIHKYRNLPADFADACLIHLADQLNTGDILTLDQDFRTYRWRKTKPFHLLIDSER